MQSNTIVATVLICGCGFLVACESSPAKKTSRHRTREAAPVAAADRAADPGVYRDPVMRATLREKALTFLAASAASGPPEERVNAIEALQVSPARLYPVLDAAVNDPVIAVRAVAAMTVGRAKLDAAVSKVRPLVNDATPQVRASALYALHRCGEGTDLTPMAAMLYDKDLRVRSQTAFLLGDIGDPSALDLLRDSAHASTSRASPAEVRIWALQLAEAETKLGDDRAIQEIRAALFPAKPEDLEATALACQIVGQLRDQASVNRLIVLTAVQDDSKQFMPAEIRLGAAAALAKMGQRQGSYIADQYRQSEKDSLRAQSAFVYGATRQIDNLPTLADMLGDPVGRVRVAAAAAIVKITDAETQAVSGVQTGDR